MQEMAWIHVEEKSRNGTNSGQGHDVFDRVLKSTNLSRKWWQGEKNMENVTITFIMFIVLSEIGSRTESPGS